MDLASNIASSTSNASSTSKAKASPKKEPVEEDGKRKRPRPKKFRKIAAESSPARALGKGYKFELDDHQINQDLYQDQGVPLRSKRTDVTGKDKKSKEYKFANSAVDDPELIKRKKNKKKTKAKMEVQATLDGNDVKLKTSRPMSGKKSADSKTPSKKGYMTMSAEHEEITYSSHETPDVKDEVRKDKEMNRTKSPMITDAEVTEAVLQKLEKDGIYPLKKKSQRFPQAKFFCRLCEYHCDTFTICRRHIKDTRHKRLKQMKTTEILLRNLPPPCKAHAEALTTLLQCVYKQHGMNDAERQLRHGVVSLIHEFISDKIPGVSLNMYGSSVTGFALKVSDINIDVTSENAAKTLSKLHQILREDSTGYFKDVTANFSAKVPCITFREARHNMQVQLSINSSTACQTTQLLAAYSSIDPRVNILAIVFRYWARLCHIDDQQVGTMPSYVFGLMTIYFLQHCSPPVLPVLHEIQPLNGSTSKDVDYYLKDIDRLSEIWTCKNTQSLGELWYELLRFYSIQFDIANNVICIRQWKQMPREEKKWSSRRIAVEDPFAKKRNVARSVSHSHVFEYIYDRMRAAFQYYGVPHTKNGPLPINISPSRLEDQLHQSLSLLHEGANDLLSKEAKELNAGKNKMDAVGEAVGDITVEDLESQRTPEDSKGDRELNTSAWTSTEKPVEKSAEQSLAEDKMTSQKGSIDRLCPLVSDLKIQNEKESEISMEQNMIMKDMEQDSSKGNDFHECDEGKDQTDSIDGDILSSSCDDQHEEDWYVFKFDEETLSDGKGPAVMCSLCQQEGHLKQDCPDEKLPELEPLPPMTSQFKNLLEQILWQVPKDFEPSPREMALRKDVLLEVQEFIQKLYPNATLSLFGSSCNGFGFKGSDLDICLTFGGSRPSELDCVDVIEKLAHKLRKHRGLYDILPITTAKVPIVKFKHRKSNLEGDISLYNTLAQHNTSMLLMYSVIDYRVRVLGYTLKVFAKLCDICDASRGSLSSYAYTLMVIYYLQQRSPPIIPVLQECYANEKPKVMVDGWNAWYYNDLKSLPKVWPECGKNKESLAELWIGLLRFYTEEFSFKDFVVSIRQHEPLTRFEKLWNGKCIAIEDPFDLSHNLGAGISRKMNMYIMKSFRRGRLIFGTPIERPPRGYYMLQDYLFDPKLLTEGLPPNDRGCRVCNKIGHYAKECPIVLARKERQNQSRESKRTDRENKNAMEQTPDRQMSHEPESTRDHVRQHKTVGCPIPQSPHEQHQFQQGFNQGTPPGLAGSPGSFFSSSPGSKYGSPVFYNSKYGEMSPPSCNVPSSGNMVPSPRAVGRHPVTAWHDASPDRLTWQQEQMMGISRKARPIMVPVSTAPQTTSFMTDPWPLTVQSTMAPSSMWSTTSAVRTQPNQSPDNIQGWNMMPTMVAASANRQLPSGIYADARMVHGVQDCRNLEMSMTNEQYNPRQTERRCDSQPLPSPIQRLFSK